MAPTHRFPSDIYDTDPDRPDEADDKADQPEASSAGQTMSRSEQYRVTLSVPLAANAAGAIADLWMTLLAFPADVRLEDHPDGVRILGRESDRRGALSVTAVVWDALVGAAVAAVGVFLLLAVGRTVVLDVLGIDSLTIGTPDTFTFLFSFASTPTEIAMSVGPGVLGIGAAVGLLYAFVRSYRRARSPGSEPRTQTEPQKSGR